MEGNQTSFMFVLAIARFLMFVFFCVSGERVVLFLCLQLSVPVQSMARKGSSPE